MKRRIEENRWGRTARWNSSLSPLGPWVHLRAGMREIYPVIEGGRVAEKRHAFKGGRRRRAVYFIGAVARKFEQQVTIVYKGKRVTRPQVHRPSVAHPCRGKPTKHRSWPRPTTRLRRSSIQIYVYIYICVYIFLSFLFIQIAPYYSVIDNLWLSSHGGLLLVGVRKMGGFLRGMFERGMWYRREEWIFEKESTF